jgi:hypothetical protein
VAVKTSVLVMNLAKVTEGAAAEAAAVEGEG